MSKMAALSAMAGRAGGAMGAAGGAVGARMGAASTALQTSKVGVAVSNTAAKEVGITINYGQIGLVLMFGFLYLVIAALGIDMFNKSGLLNIITNKVFEKKTPILGICVGMQMLTRRSEEGRLPGLAWIQGETIRFRFSNENKKFRVPHMGWNQVFPAKESALTQDFFTESRFYFVHSYLVKCDDRNDILLETEYGSRFTSAIEHKNIFGVQFHPEKSHKFGMKLLKNFCKLD